MLSLADTLDGEVNVAMLVYQSGEAAIQLFSGDSPQARKILGAALPALATQGDYKVLLVQPEDQDFDVALVARARGSLVELEMVKVKEGQEERFQQLRNQYKARARSSSNVQDVQVFKVVQVMAFTSHTPHISHISHISHHSSGHAGAAARGQLVPLPRGW